MKWKEWLQRGEQSADPFEALSNHWRAFNHLFAESKGGTERDKIEAFVKARLTDESAARILQARSEEVRCLTSEPVVDMRGNGKDTTSQMEAFASSGSALERLVAICLITYQVRCNLEHGQKSPSRQRDADLCSAASPVVGDVVRCTN
jgi:hypothetical protein